MLKNKREQREATARGDATREHILDVALRLFRKRGFERATMREVARVAKVSLGSAYYYFPAKEALVHAFYDRVQQEHRAQVLAACSEDTALADAMRLALLAKLQLVAKDRALLGALFRFSGEPDHALSVFGEAARAQRESAIATFALTLEAASVSPRLRDAAARALWLAHLGLLLTAIHDPSEGLLRTRTLAARTADLFAMGLRLTAMPGAAKWIDPLLDALAEAGLLSEPLGGAS